MIPAAAFGCSEPPRRDPTPHIAEGTPEDGYFRCTTCDGFSVDGNPPGSVTTDCPGTPLTPEEKHAVYLGERDFVEGVWRLNASAWSRPRHERPTEQRQPFVIWPDRKEGAA